MEKKTKNIITREWIEKELRSTNKADVGLFLRCSCITGFVFVPLFPCFIWAIITSNLIISIKIILCIISLFCLYPVGYCVFYLWQGLVERKKLLNGDYDIVKRKVLYKSERERYSRHTGVNMIYYLHFADFKKRDVGKTIFELAFAGEEYYIVYFKNSKDIAELYSVERFELKD